MRHPSLHSIPDISLDKNIYNKLSIRYVIALIAIAIAIITSQALIQNFLRKQLWDSRVINVAGRQRMLSQKITKHVLLIQKSSNSEKRLKNLNELKSSLDLWKRSHYALISGDSSMMVHGNNSDTIQQMFKELTPYFKNMVSATGQLINIVQTSPQSSQSEVQTYVDKILDNEAEFLPRMDNIVNQYDKEANQKVKDVIRIETLLLIIALSILIFEFFFIFQPTAYFIKNTIHGLIQSEEKEKQSYQNIIKIKSEEQKFKSSLIFEGQERERRRLSRDLHDGIGQMLTGLKFQAEALTNNGEQIKTEKLEVIKELTSDIIKEVRRVSFNLRPTVLSDYGLSSGIKNIVNELNIYTETEITFTNETDFNDRLDKRIETHLYRITQESINNAIKYSKSDKIEIRLWHMTESVAISIKDYGIGFDPEEIEKHELKSQSGHGIFNMKERARFIDADLRIKSSKGKGTEIIIYLPLN